MKGYRTILLFLFLLIGISVSAQNTDDGYVTSTITIDASCIQGLNTENTTRSWTSGYFKGECKAYKQNSTATNMKFYATSGNSAYVYNTTPIPGKIVSVTINKGEGEDNKWKVFLDNNVLTPSTTKTNTEQLGEKTVGASGTSWTASDNNSHSYFYALKVADGKIAEISSIEINYVSSVKKTIDANDYATFSSPVKLDLSNIDGLEAYIATDCTVDKVTMEKITTAIPENTGVVLKNTGNSSVQFSIPTTTTATTPSTNLLVATTSETEVKKPETGTNYVLAGSGSSLGWYFIDNVTATLAAGRCYLHSPSTPSAKSSIPMSFKDDTAGISTTSLDTESITAYNIAGQRVAKDTKGIVIANGKKVYNR